MAIVTKAQVKKPTLMVVPADNWCVKKWIHGQVQRPRHSCKCTQL